MRFLISALFLFLVSNTVAAQDDDAIRKYHLLNQLNETKRGQLKSATVFLDSAIGTYGLAEGGSDSIKFMYTPNENLRVETLSEYSNYEGPMQLDYQSRIAYNGPDISYTLSTWYENDTISSADSTAFNYDNGLLKSRVYHRIKPQEEARPYWTFGHNAAGLVNTVSHYYTSNGEHYEETRDSISYFNGRPDEIHSWSYSSIPPHENTRYRVVVFEYNTRNFLERATTYQMNSDSSLALTREHYYEYDTDNFLSLHRETEYDSNEEPDGITELVIQKVTENRYEQITTRYNNETERMELFSKDQITYNSAYGYEDISSIYTDYMIFNDSIFGTPLDPRYQGSRGTFRYAPLYGEYFDWDTENNEWVKDGEIQFYYSGMVNIEEKDPSLEITFYPNPGNDYIQFQLPKSKRASVTITDMRGTLVMETKVVGSEKVDLSKIPHGHYIATIKTTNTSQSYRLVVE